MPSGSTRWNSNCAPVCPALAAHCRLANVTGDRLVFVVDSPVWNAKLRLASAHLVESPAPSVLGSTP